MYAGTSRAKRARPMKKFGGLGSALLSGVPLIGDIAQMIQSAMHNRRLNKRREYLQGKLRGRFAAPGAMPEVRRFYRIKDFRMFREIRSWPKNWGGAEIGCYVCRREIRFGLDNISGNFYQVYSQQFVVDLNKAVLNNQSPQSLSYTGPPGTNLSLSTLAYVRTNSIVQLMNSDSSPLVYKFYVFRLARRFNEEIGLGSSFNQPIVEANDTAVDEVNRVMEQDTNNPILETSRQNSRELYDLSRNGRMWIKKFRVPATSHRMIRFRFKGMVANDKDSVHYDLQKYRKLYMIYVQAYHELTVAKIAEDDPSIPLGGTDGIAQLISRGPVMYWRNFATFRQPTQQLMRYPRPGRLNKYTNLTVVAGSGGTLPGAIPDIAVRADIKAELTSLR